MKKKQKHMAEEMGVSIREGVMLSGENKYTLGNYLVGLLLFAMMIVGMTECFVQGFSMSCMQKWLLGGILVSCLAFYTGFSMKRGGEILVALYLIGYGVVSYYMRSHIANGLAVFVNTVLKKAGKYYGVTFVSYEEYADLNRQKSLTIFLLFVFVFMIGVLAYLTVHKIASYFVIAVTFVIAFAPEVVGLVPGEKAFALYIISVIVYLGSRMKYTNRRKLRTTEMKVQWKIRLMQIVVGIASVFLFFQVFTEATYDKISRETDLKTFLQNAIQTCYNNTIRKGLDKGTVDGGISFGDISGVDRIQYSDTVRLRVKYKSLDLRQRAGGGLYLRGYVGSKYEDEQWKPLSEAEETDCNKMEENSGIYLDDYDTAAASYRMALETFFEHKPSNCIFWFHEGTTENLEINYKDTMGETDFWYKKYNYETFRNGIKSICSAVVSDIIVENVSETVSTQFVPYYVASDVREEEGRFISEEITDVGEYEWSIFNGQAEAFGVVTDPYVSYDIESQLDYYDKMKILWKEFLDIKAQVEDTCGQKILDYEEGSYKGKSIKEVCPELAKKLEVTISVDTSKEIDEIDTDGKYDVKELMRRIARTGTSTYSSDDIYNYTSSVRMPTEIADASRSVPEVEIYREDEGEEAVGAIYGEYEVNEYDEELENETWEELHGAEFAVRKLYESKDADKFFSLLKRMYQFYVQQQEYENFVERTYMDVPENIKEKLEGVLKEDMTGVTDLRQTISFVQNYLYDNTEYSLEPGTTPEGEDFVEYFLFKNKKGYCVHYATAATMMFRSMGVPARYVEGYHADKEVLQEKDVVTMEGASLWHAVDLTDRYAHAWVEIYISGYGWIPVEVTKTYFGVEESVKPSKTPTATASSNGKNTKAPSSTVNPGKQTSAPENSAEQETIDYTLYYPIVYAILGIASLLLVIGLRYGIITKKYEKEGNVENANKALYFYYIRMEQILRIQKYCGKEQSLRQLLQEQAIAIDGVDAKVWLHFYELMNDYTFSKNGVTANQAAEGRQLYETVRAAFYSEKKIWMRWYYKYIRCI